VQAGAVLVSDDEGSTWREIWRQASGVGLLDMLALDDGTILGSRADADGGGVVRSTDGGRTWTT
jgi:photosystem II stability/assembly factor-like uncharacterized protein